MSDETPKPVLKPDFQAMEIRKRLGGQLSEADANQRISEIRAKNPGHLDVQEEVKKILDAAERKKPKP